MTTNYIAIAIAVALVGGALLYAGVRGPGGEPQIADDANNANNVSIVDGKQVIAITAKGGYSPRVTNAKAGIPTVIKMDTRGTFDCSSALAIPSIGYQKNLPPSGETTIELPPQKAGTNMRGLCAMGMYNFSINFD